jgi:ABC-type bacteriocin/lantibiotic exporter with double-glycine peptidase domain
VTSSLDLKVQVFNNAIAALFSSFLFGMLFDAMLRRLSIYEWLSTRYLFANAKTYERLGVLWFRKFLLATPLRYFNTNIRFTQSRDLSLLKTIRGYIAAAEVSHWIAFVMMSVWMAAAWWYSGPKVGVAFLVLNIVGNLYPCLLQQYNKRRLAVLIAVVEKRAK